MRALFMDFPDDPNVADIPDEYMFGPAFLVAPVTEQGATQPEVYLPAGCDWYNYWTNERYQGRPDHHGRRSDRYASRCLCGPVPLCRWGGHFERAAAADIASVRVYPGADADFTLFSDDGTTYAYEKGAGSTHQASLG